MNNEPVFKTRDAFKVVGIERYTKDGIPSIQEAWTEFSNRRSEIRHAVSQMPFGVEDYSRDLDMNAGGFPKYYYIAGLQVNDLHDIPAGMSGKEIRAAKYAVFTYQGPIGDLHRFFQFIYGQWMPASGYVMDSNLSLDFEYYPAPMTDMQNATVEIWVPVVKKS